MTLYNIFYIDETIGWTEYLATTDNPEKWIVKNGKNQNSDYFDIKEINLELFNNKEK